MRQPKSTTSVLLKLKGLTAGILNVSEIPEETHTPGEEEDEKEEKEEEDEKDVFEETEEMEDIEEVFGQMCIE